MESQGLVYLQEFIALDSPRDIRAFVVDGKVLGAIYRVAPPGQWISNLARGGQAVACPLTEELVELAARAGQGGGHRLLRRGSPGDAPAAHRSSR